VGERGGFGGLRDGNSQLTGKERDLSDKSGGSVGAIELRGRSTQGFAVTDQLVEILVLISDLGEHPLSEQGEELLNFHPFKQVEEGGVAGRPGQLQIEGCTEGLEMPFGKTLEIPGAATATEDSKDGHQQQQSLGITDPTALAPFWQSLQKGDQISSGSRVGQQTGAVPTKPPPAWPHQQPCAGL